MLGKQRLSPSLRFSPLIMKNILVINAGSSSLKFAVFPQAFLEGSLPSYRGLIEGIGEQARIVIMNALHERVLDAAIDVDVGADLEAQHAAALKTLMSWLDAQQLPLTAVGHRVLHGGDRYSAPVKLDAERLAALSTLIPLGPLHQPHNLRAVRLIAEHFPTLPQVACFDTAFHHTQRRLAQIYAIPHALTESGIKRYGFHGLSYEYISRQLPGVLGAAAHGAVIVAHLGNGASMCVMRDLKSVATSMGFTAAEGLMMGTRSGSIDPGVLLYMLQHHGYDADKLTHMLYCESGLLGVSGIAADIRTLEASDSPHALEAIELFCYRAACEVGTLAVAAGGLDGLVFTGGIGEHSRNIRARIVKHLAWLGIDMDAEANAVHTGSFRFDRPQSRVALAVIPTNEEWMIANHTAVLLRGLAHD